MAVYKSKGIVLRSIRYSEADRILDLYTTEAGLVSAIVKGIRRTKSRSEPASNRSLRRLRRLPWQDARHRDPGGDAAQLPRHQEDLARFETAAGMVGSVRALSGGTRRTAGSSTCSTTPCTLETSDSGFENIEAALGIKLSILAGCAATRLPGLWDDLDAASEPLHFAPTTGASCARSAADRRRVPARPHTGEPEDPRRKSHPSSTRTNRTTRERPQGGPLPRPRPRREYPGRPTPRRRRTPRVDPETGVGLATILPPGPLNTAWPPQARGLRRCPQATLPPTGTALSTPRRSAGSCTRPRSSSP